MRTFQFLQHLCHMLSVERMQSLLFGCRWGLAALPCCWLMMTSTAVAQPGKHLDRLSWDRNVAGLVRKYCYGCHNSENTKGNVNLAQDVDPRLILDHRPVWENAQSMLEADLMPPKKARQPTDEERQMMIDFLEQTLSSLDCSAVQNPGPPPFRRLNHVEYNLSIADLTGLDLRPADNFSPDPSSFGFDTIGESLQLSPVQVEQYHQAARQIAHTLLAGDWQHNSRHPLWEIDLQSAGASRQAIARFATRAFRRPVEPEYVDKLMAIYDKAIARGDSPEQALEAPLTAILISPRFLVRIEAARPDQSEPYLVDDYELASRLSYFLWSRPPDDHLLKLAAQKKLGKPDVLRAETLRMLADSRSQGLVDNFFGQWFEVRQLDTHQPDQKVFPEYNQFLQQSMQDEARAFLAEIVQKNRPIRELIDANYTYLNQELANWYGISGVQGKDLKRVVLTDRRRGGILTTAAVLMLQSDPGRTNIPRRGNYLAGRILGDSAPPPPPDIPDLTEAAQGGKVLTVRERLELHRQKPECGSCHSRIDPLGFSLENYDALGRWRDAEAGRPVDSSGELPDGRRVSGPIELKDILLEREDAFTRTLLQNLLIYALGRPLQADDECVIRDGMAVAAAHEGRFGELVVSIVGSTPFRYRRNADY